MSKTVILETNLGRIELELFPEFAPKACENFATHAENGFYNGVIFHRVIKEFMIQGGDPTGTGMGGGSIWEKPFEDECCDELSFDEPGLLAMANAGPCTNGSQFFITTAETPWLNGRHTIFGKVAKGMEAVTKIENTEVDGGDRPINEVVIQRAYVKELAGNGKA